MLKQTILEMLREEYWVTCLTKTSKDADRFLAEFRSYVDSEGYTFSGVGYSYLLEHTGARLVVTGPWSSAVPKPTPVVVVDASLPQEEAKSILSKTVAPGTEALVLYSFRGVQ